MRSGEWESDSCESSVKGRKARRGRIQIMKYIVFDLEWNQCPDGKEQETAGLPFEVIEIGAVRLNAGREETGSFHRVIRPAVYPRLHHRTREIVKMSEEELAAGIPFAQAAREFLDWAGAEAVFCTWGPGDLTELQRNLKYYGMLGLLKGPLHFYDVQKLFAVNFENMKERRSLEYGIDYLELAKTQEFHQAMSDARYTAEIFRKIDQDVVYAYDSIDVYQPPRTKEEEIFAVYNGYTKFISRTFETKEALMHDREVLSTQCCRCEKMAKKKLRWHSAGAKNYFCAAVCREHGYVKGKIRIKRTDEGRFFAVKTIKVSGEPELEELFRKREELAQKRRKKRGKKDSRNGSGKTKL